MKLYAVFSKSGGLKKGRPEATASLASPDIHHWLSDRHKKCFLLHLLIFQNILLNSQLIKHFIYFFNFYF